MSPPPRRCETKKGFRVVRFMMFQNPFKIMQLQNKLFISHNSVRKSIKNTTIHHKSINMYSNSSRYSSSFTITNEAVVPIEIFSTRIIVQNTTTETMIVPSMISNNSLNWEHAPMMEILIDDFEGECLFQRHGHPLRMSALYRHCILIEDWEVPVSQTMKVAIEV